MVSREFLKIMQYFIIERESLYIFTGKFNFSNEK